MLKRMGSFRGALYATLVLVGVVPLLLFFGFNAAGSYSRSIAETDAYMEANLALTAELLDSNLGMFSGMVSYLVDDQNVVEILRKDDTVNAGRIFEDTQRLYIETWRIMSVMRVDVPVHLVNIHQKSRFSTTDYFDPRYTGVRGDFYSQMDAAPTTRQQYYIRRRIDGAGQQSVSFSIGKAVRDYPDTDVIVGYVIVDVYDGYFQSVLDKVALQQDTQVYLLDKNGVIITERVNLNETGFAAGEELTGGLVGEQGQFDTSYGGVRCRAYYRQTNVFGIWVVQLVPHSYFYAAAFASMWALVPVLLLLLLTLVLGTRLLSSRLARPVRQLSKAMQTVQTGNFSTSVVLEGPAELAALGDSFNEMAGRLGTLVEKEYKNEVLIQEARFESLKAQMEPHFLYNCMNMISMMATLGETRKVAAVTQALSQYYRYNVSDISRMATLRDELEQARRYLEIQQIRYADRLRFTVAAEEDILDCSMLRLLLQPLVENAIVHGIEKILEPGEVNVLALRDGDDILIHVMDNGPGFPAGYLPGESVGLGNAMKRMEIYYRSGWALTHTRTGEFTVVELRFPKNSGREETPPC